MANETTSITTPEEAQALMARLNTFLSNTHTQANDKTKAAITSIETRAAKGFTTSYTQVLTGIYLAALCMAVVSSFAMYGTVLGIGLTVVTVSAPAYYYLRDES